MKFDQRTLTFFSGTTLLALLATPLHVYAVGFYWFNLWLLVGMTILTLMSITCGYHRLFAHRSYQAAGWVKGFFLLFGAAAFQESCAKWSAEHRVHHHYVDDPKRDPYARTRGFWWSHMGWILSSGRPKVPIPQDLLDDPWVAWQKKYWIFLGIASGFVFPAALGLFWGDPLGAFLFGGVLRLVLCHHLTFCINSLAHTLGKQPYSRENTAKDHWLTSLLTFGEGYHNFHHWYSRDYRNGIRAYQWDPGKWCIWTFNKLGWAWDLRRASQEQILVARAKLSTETLVKDSCAAWAAAFQEQYVAMAAKMTALDQRRQAWLEAKRKQSVEDYRQTLEQIRTAFLQAKDEANLAYQEWKSLLAQAKKQKSFAS